MEEVIITTIQLKRANSTVWASENPVLAEGELGFEIDTGKLKIGDGSTLWNSLEYSVRQVDNILMDGNSIKSTNTNGDITLDPDGTGKVIGTSDIVAHGDLYAQTNKKVATEDYVESSRQLLDVKASVRAATTGDISLSGLQSVDDVSLADGDRVLVKDQNLPSQNGIYRVSSGVWTRSSDADISDDLTAGTFTFVEEGTINADSGWVLTTNQPIAVGTTGLSFTQFSGAGQIITGDGLAKSGNEISIDPNYSGQTSISTLGSVTTGSWQADEIGAEYGGTGLNSYAVGDILYASGANSLSRLPAGAGYFLRMNQSGTAPEWSNSIDGGSP
jgi:hypothetical protein